ncbi:MAG: hypothetical protein AB7I27_17695 [Bacteriovoracaceae bacterium]
MKFLLIVFFLVFTSAKADEIKSEQTNEQGKNVQSVLKDAKKDRKKKVEMCHDCGKPEVNCDCEGEEHKKDE